MYAIIRTGGKQYRVKKGDFVDVERIQGEPGDSYAFEEVLFVTDGKDVQVGAPCVAGYSVQAKVVGPTVGPKVTSVKHVPRGHQRRKWGHRQHYTRLEILDIQGKGKKKEEQGE